MNMDLNDGLNKYKSYTEDYEFYHSIRIRGTKDTGIT